MKKYLLLFWFLLSFIETSLAQSTYQVTVLDSQTRRPLAGAAVGIAGSSSGAVANEKGQFVINISAGTDSISVSLPGYYPRKIAIELLASQKIILLNPNAAELREVVVTGYETNRPLLKTAGSFGVLNSRELERFSNTTLVPALNTLPGVRMEERATGSYRLSIRGSTLRAPFGIRNVKLYLNDIPLVEANGTIPLNLFDAASIGKIEVLKGPAGSVYGAGTGGAVLLETARPNAEETSVSGQVLAGSYGLRRYTASVSTSNKTSGILAQYNKQELGGYRQQSALDRKTLLLSGKFFPSDKQTFTFHGYYSDLYYELPGALTKEQYEADPRQARPLHIEQRVSLKLNGLNLGLNHTYQFNDRWSNSTSVFGVFSFLDHPFSNDYERNTNQSYGGRTKTTYQITLSQLPARFTAGGEWQRSFINSRHYQNIKGRPDTLRFDDEVTATQGFVFGQAEVDLPHQFIAVLGASLNYIHYDLARITDAAVQDNYRYNRSFKPQLSPRLGLVKILSPQISAHGSISTGFSPPTEAEIRPSDGSFNTALQPEKGLNYELGLRGRTLQRKLTFDVVGFAFKLRETIVSRTNPEGVVIFQNAGATKQRGIETALAYTLVQEPAQTLSVLRIWSNYTYNNFRFLNYQQNEKDYSGNQLTGTPTHVWIGGLDAESRLGLYTNITTNFTSDIPLNDANTVLADKYFVLGARAGWRKIIRQKFNAELYGGVDNILDKTYSLGNDLNGFGNRYFQAAPGINFYTGLKLGYILSKR